MWPHPWASARFGGEGGWKGRWALVNAGLWSTSEAASAARPEAGDEGEAEAQDCDGAGGLRWGNVMTWKLGRRASPDLTETAANEAGRRRELQGHAELLHSTATCGG